MGSYSHTRDPSDPEAVRAQLAEILGSRQFSRSERRQRLLTYLVEEALAGRADAVRAHVVGSAVLGRGPRFDPQTDPIVRVETHRLRGALDSFYRAHPAAPVVISIPRGGLVARFAPGSGVATSQPSMGVCVLACPDAADSHLAEGVACSLAAALTPFEGLRVAGPLPAVAGGSDAGALAAEAEVRFLLRGSLRRAGGRIRIRLHLTDVEASEEIWSQLLELDAATHDAFAVEDAVVERVTGKVAGPNSVIARRLGPSWSRDGSSTLQRALQAHEAFVSHPSAVTWSHGREILAGAARREPENGRILGLLADLQLSGWWLGLDDDAERRRQAEELAARAASLEPDSQNARFSLAFAHFLGRRSELFRAEVEHVSALNPHNAVILASLGLLVGCEGELERGLSMIDEAVRKNPGVPPWWRLLSCLRRYREAEYDLAWPEAEMFAMPGLYLDPLLRVACLGALGRRDEAAPEVERLRHSLPGTRARLLLRRLLHDDDLVERLLAGLAGAGTPVDTRIRIAHRA